MTTTEPTPEAVEALARVIADDGWTCEYHEPVSRGECSGCDEAHDGLARGILAALNAQMQAQVAAAWDRGYRDGESAATGSIRAGARIVVDNPYRAIGGQS